jgi:hypothetical protein
VNSVSILVHQGGRSMSAEVRREGDSEARRLHVLSVHSVALQPAGFTKSQNSIASLQPPAVAGVEPSYSYHAFTRTRLDPPFSEFGLC